MPPKRILLGMLAGGLLSSLAVGAGEEGVGSPLRPTGWEPEQLEDRLKSLSAEPSIRQVQEAAIRYAEVDPEKILRWRKTAAWRTWLPKFTLHLDRDRSQTIASSSSQGKTTFSVGPEDESFRLGFDFTWDLANFIWNPDQISIDARSRLTTQLRQDLLEEVTKVYYERRRLLLEFQGSPTEDPILKAERLLRVEELTAFLDAGTGGAFSREIPR